MVAGVSQILVTEPTKPRASLRQRDPRLATGLGHRGNPPVPTRLDPLAENLQPWPHPALADQWTDFAVLIDDVHVDPIFVFRFFGCDRGRTLLEAGQASHIRGVGQLALGGGHVTLRTFEGGGAEVPKADTERAVPERIDFRHEDRLFDVFDPRHHVALGDRPDALAEGGTLGIEFDEKLAQFLGHLHDIRPLHIRLIPAPPSIEGRMFFRLGHEGNQSRFQFRALRVEIGGRLDVAKNLEFHQRVQAHQHLEPELVREGEHG